MQDRKEVTRRKAIGGMLKGGLGLAGLSTGLAGCVGSNRTGGATAPGLLVVAVDGLRADHLGIYGYDRETSPNLDSLSTDGVVFGQAFSSSPRLLPAHVSLLTGCQPWVARRYLPTERDVSFERRWRLPVKVPHFAVDLLSKGWATAAFVDHSEVAPIYGFRTGFQLFVDSADELTTGLSGLDRRIQQWVRGVDQDRPFFAYVQLHDLERSWADPDPEWERYFPARAELSEVPPNGMTDSVLFSVPYSRRRGSAVTLGAYEAAYDGHIRRLDKQLNSLFEGLRAIGRYEDTTIVVVGSHGLQFGEAGLYLSAGRYSVADLHVPLIIRPRRGALDESRRGIRLDGVTSSTDLVPTLLGLEGLAIPAGTHGVSHARSIRDAVAGWSRELAFSSCGIQEGCALFGSRYVLEYLLADGVSNPQLRRSWFGEDVGSYSSPRARFYDRSINPHPALSDAPRADAMETFERYRIAAAEWISTMEEMRRALHGNSAFGESVDGETLARLRAEGYLP
ncbi:MAG: hypothetical protein ACI8PQ_001889 [Planctomycetota bacterium]|jgi:hypothetical protein